MGGFPFIAGLTGQLGTFIIDLVGQAFHAVIRLGDGRGTKGIGPVQIRAGGNILQVNILDDIGPGQRQKVVIAF